MGCNRKCKCHWSWKKLFISIYVPSNVLKVVFAKWQHKQQQKLSRIKKAHCVVVSCHFICRKAYYCPHHGCHVVYIIMLQCSKEILFFLQSNDKHITSISFYNICHNGHMFWKGKKSICTNQQSNWKWHLFKEKCVSQLPTQLPRKVGRGKTWWCRWWHAKCVTANATFRWIFDVSEHADNWGCWEEIIIGTHSKTSIEGCQPQKNAPNYVVE